MIMLWNVLFCEESGEGSNLFFDMSQDAVLEQIPETGSTRKLVCRAVEATAKECASGIQGDWHWVIGHKSSLGNFTEISSLLFLLLPQRMTFWRRGNLQQFCLLNKSESVFKFQSDIWKLNIVLVVDNWLMWHTYI